MAKYRIHSGPVFLVTDGSCPPAAVDARNVLMTLRPG